MVALLAGCGGGDGKRAGAAPSTRLVDLAAAPPYVNSFDIDPDSQDFLLTTNRGFYRIARESGRVRPLRGHISVQGTKATVGSFLEVAALGPGKLIGSGHPDQDGTLPPALGVLRSGDGGETWQVVSRLGQADLHKIVVKGGKLYALDAVLNALLVSGDEGRTFAEAYTPAGQVMVDFDVDPADPARVVASSDLALFGSADAGKTWKQLEALAGVRLAWPAADALYRALKDGTVQISGDGGQTWRRASRVGGEPYAFKPVARDELYLALGDGTILHTRDGARTWDEAFVP